MIPDTDYITFKEDTHQYFDPEKVEYASVSSVIKSIEKPFDRQGISRAMAKSKARKEGISIEKAQDIILSKWDEKGDFSRYTGTDIHDIIENFLLTSKSPDRYSKVCNSIAWFLRNNYRYYPETIVHSKEHCIAGMVDLPTERTKSKKSPIDIFDYKTNTEQGITTFTAKMDKEKNKVIKYYNDYFLPPLDHMEHTNYNKYTLQMSLYAVMMQMMTGRPIGRLGILFIGHLTQKVTFYPVPYMKMEALALMDHFRTLKPLPQKISQLTEQEASWEDN